MAVRRGGRGKRRTSPENIEKVLWISQQRCALCFVLNGDADRKTGDIGRLDVKKSKNDIDNLIFLCKLHFQPYFDQAEPIRSYRDYLYASLPPYEKLEEGEILYEDSGFGSVVAVDINKEIKRYLSRHPEQVYNLTPRGFEELIASILDDMGLDVNLTQSTRDGGVDIYAYVKNQVCSFLILVECKKWAKDNPVGLDVVQRLYGVQTAKRANKSMIVTTSRFSDPAVEECNQFQGQMELKDYKDLKKWLKQYDTN